MGASLDDDEFEEASGTIGSGKYRLFARVGHGGMADVVLGVALGPKGFSKVVVVKRLRTAMAGDRSMVEMFLDEARLAARLNHPNVVNTFEVGEQDSGYFIAMEYLDGQSLQKVMAVAKTTAMGIPPVICARIAADALAGLHYAHELVDYDGTKLDVIHRDVSPQNIFVTYDGRIKIVDFGIAKAALNAAKTETGVLKGKVAYMAPEQLQGLEIDRRADIFAMGIVLHESLTGERLVTGEPAAAMHKMLNMVFPPVRALRPDVPEALEAIVTKALQRDPAARFQTALEMRQALESFIRETGETATEEQTAALMSSLFAETQVSIRKRIQKHMASMSESAITSSSASSSKRRLIEPSAPRDEASDAAMQALDRLSGETHAPSAHLRKTPFVIATVLALVIAGAVAASRRTVEIPARAPAPVTPATVRIAFRVTPPAATILLDDEALGASPAEVTRKADGAEHDLRISAPGHLPLARRLRFERDLDLTFVLEPAAAAAPPPAPVDSATKTAPKRPSPAPSTPSKKSPGRPELEDDPWH